MKTPLIYEPNAGEQIENAFRQSIRIATENNRPVRFEFNGDRWTVTKRLTVPFLMRQWVEKREANSRKYKASKRGKDEARKRASEIIRKQAEIDKLLAALPLVLSSMNATMEWLKSYTELADDISVKDSRDKVAVMLHGAGYSENEHVGKKTEWFNTRDRMGRYIIGQALECMRRGMPPHPITLTFCARYFALP